MKDLGEGDADFAARLHRAIAARGITLSWLRTRLVDSGNPVSLATLSYWRTGRRTPEGPNSLAAISEIEDLLNLPPGHLTEVVVPRQRAWPMSVPEIPIPESDVRTAAEETLRALGSATLSGLRDLNTHVVVDVGPSGRIERRAVRSIIESTAGTIDEIPYLYIAMEPFSAPPVPTDVRGARIVREHIHPSGHIAGWVFELDAPLEAPGRTMVEWTAVFPDDGLSMTRCEHRVSRKSNDITVWVRFHPDRLPEWCEERSTEPRGATRRTIEPAPSIHATRRSFGPGTLELRWGFDSPNPLGS